MIMLVFVVFILTTMGCEKNEIDSPIEKGKCKVEYNYSITEEIERIELIWYTNTINIETYDSFAEMPTELETGMGYLINVTVIIKAGNSIVMKNKYIAMFDIEACEGHKVIHFKEIV